MKRCAILLAVLTLATACKQSGGSVIVPSLERPGPLAFACFSEVDSALTMELSACDGMTGASSEPFRVFSFGIESTRGEVAVIDWQAVRAVDSDRTVPGFTFVHVGEAPSAIVIPENDSRMTFVANYGSYSVQSLETASFVPDALQDTDDLLHPTTVTLPAGPTDLEYLSVGGAAWLFAALPDAGAVAQIPVAADGSLGAPTLIPVSTTLPAQVAASTEPDYIRICPIPTDVRRATAAPRVPRSLGALARPSRLALVERAGTVELVASDASLPVIHRFTTAAGGLTEVSGFATAVPTLEVAATPLVQPTHTDLSTTETAATATEQFVYAIDAIDRSVLVVSVGTGAVLPVNVGDRVADRVTIDAPAIALESVTPGYDVSDETFLGRCNPATGDRRTTAAPGAMRGVFMAVSTTDGNVTLLDIYDLDATCRGPAACLGTGNANDTLVYEHRHRPRMAGLAVEAPYLGSSLSFSYLGGSGGLASTGAASSGIGPGLLPIDDGTPGDKLCPGTTLTSGRGRMYAAIASSGDAQIEGEPLICLLDDAASIRAQRFAATWEALIPTAQGVRGTLVDGGAGSHTFVTEDGDFCSWGVLGSADVTSAGLSSMDPELGYAGDSLVITADVPLATRADAACKDLLIATSGTARIRIAFEIKQAFGDHLVLGDFVRDANYTLPSIFNSDPVGAFARISSCFPGLVSYEVHVHNAYLVSSTSSMPRHRIIEGVGTACTIDLAGQPFDPAQPDTARSFRALPGQNFIHPQIAFRPSTYADLKSGMSAQLVVDVTNVQTPLRLDSGFLGVALRFNPADQHLYTIDEPTHGVSQFDLDPVSTLHRVQ